MFKAIKDFFKTGWLIITHPSYIFMHGDYHHTTDIKVNYLLDTCEFSDLHTYTVQLGDDKFWISNRPYASATFYNDNRVSGLRPSRLTIKRFLDKLDAYELEVFHKEINSGPVS